MLLQSTTKVSESVESSESLTGRHAIVLKNLGFRRNGLLLFDGLSEQFSAGQTTCILGVSGVGKSSLLIVIAGLLPDPEFGSACDEDGRSLRGRIAYMAQDDLLLPWANVFRNVTLGCRLRGDDIDDDNARELIQLVGLAEHVEALPHTLSGGMRQRVALARTLMEKRPIALLDEPFSALDALTRYQLQSLVAELFRGRTVVIVTHDPVEALRLGHSIRVMYGRPALLSEPMRLGGQPPRDPTAPKVASLQRELLNRLGISPAEV